MPAIIRWSPARELVRLSDAMDRMFEDSWTRPCSRPAPSASSACRWMCTPRRARSCLRPMCPASSRTKSRSRSKATRCPFAASSKPPMENVDYIFQERPYGKFSRTLTINVPVDNDKVEATFENGVLTITLPKAEAARPKIIKVEAKK